MISTQSPVSLAVSRAIAEAEVRRLEMARGMDQARVGSLLNAQADETARSPLAYDQLLALALRAAASPGEPDHATLDALRTPADGLERQAVAGAVFTRYSEAPFRALLRGAPDQELHRGARRVGREPQSLAHWLRAAADLAHGLWDHPALPVDPSMRGAMLATVTALRRRAAAMGATPPARSPIEEIGA